MTIQRNLDQCGHVSCVWDQKVCPGCRDSTVSLFQRYISYSVFRIDTQKSVLKMELSVLYVMKALLNVNVGVNTCHRMHSILC